MSMLNREPSFSFSQLSHQQNMSTVGTPPKKVAMLTAGGLAPCLSSAVGALIHEYDAKYPGVEIICYINGYKGLLLGDFINVGPEIRSTAEWLHNHGGSPIGNSRVKLTNVKDCVKRGEHTTAAPARTPHQAPACTCHVRHLVCTMLEHV